MWLMLNIFFSDVLNRMQSLEELVDMLTFDSYTQYLCFGSTFPQMTKILY